MKIIDLLNKIANDEEVPKKINFCMRNFEYQKDIDDYLCIDENFGEIGDYCLDVSICKWIFPSMLNSEVEILDDEDEEKESLYKPYALFEFEYTDDLHEIIKKSNINFKSISEKVNEIIYYLEKQRKGE